MSTTTRNKPDPKAKVIGRIADLMREKGINGRLLAGKVGVSESAVSKWLSGKSFPEFEHMAAMAEMMNVHLSAIVCPVESVARPIPLDGGGEINLDEALLEKCGITRDMGVRAIRVEGASMAPTISHGDIAIYAMNGETVTDGMVYAVTVQKKVAIRRAWIGGRNEIEFRCDNQKYERDATVFGKSPQVDGVVMMVIKQCFARTATLPGRTASKTAQPGSAKPVKPRAPSRRAG